MQRWTLDATSLFSFLLVVAASSALPAPGYAALLGTELLFAAFTLLRYGHSHTHSPSPAAQPAARSSPRRPATSPWSRRLRAVTFRYLHARLLRAWGRKQQAAAQHDAAGEVGSQAAAAAAAASAVQQPGDAGCVPDTVADRLFDPKEGHLSVLSGGHLAMWFQGLAGPHQLQPSHVMQLLAYLLSSNPGSSASSPATSTSSTSSPADQHPGCPKIRGWAARLMELLQLPAASSAAPAAPTAPAPTVNPDANADAKLLACQQDPLVASYRPLTFYLLMEAVAAATHVTLLGMGFRAQPLPYGTATVYDWSPAAQDSSTSPAATKDGVQQGEQEQGDEPVVFLHGIGMGLTPYLRLLGRLVAGGGGRRRVLAVQYKHVSMRFTTRIPAPHEVADDVAAFLRDRGISRVSILAHSYGTFVASALNKLASSATSSPSSPSTPSAPSSPAPLSVSRLTLVDPVCFAMFLPHLVRNAIYRQPAAGHEPPRAATLRGRLLRSLLNGLVTAEYHCSVALRRRLHWVHVNLWPSELPADATVVLSGRDNLVPVAEIRQILANRAALVGPSAPQPAVLYHEGHGHGGFLGDLPWQTKVLAAALGMDEQAVQRGIDAAAAAAENKTAAKTAGVPAAPAAAPVLAPAFAPVFGTAEDNMDALASAASPPASSLPAPSQYPPALVPLPDSPALSSFSSPAAFRTPQPPAANGPNDPDLLDRELQDLLLGALAWQRYISLVEAEAKQLQLQRHIQGQMEGEETEAEPVGQDAWAGPYRRGSDGGAAGRGGLVPSPWVAAAGMARPGAGSGALSVGSGWSGGGVLGSSLRGGGVVGGGGMVVAGRGSSSLRVGRPWEGVCRASGAAGDGGACGVAQVWRRVDVAVGKGGGGVGGGRVRPRAGLAARWASSASGVSFVRGLARAL